MIYTVTLNPSLDCVMTLDCLNPGTLHRAEAQVLHPAGKGINVARTLAQFGEEVCALGFVAGETGTLFETLLANEPFTKQFFRLNGCTRINVKVRAGEETELNGAGPAANADSLALLMDALSALTHEDFLVLCGSSLPQLPSDVYARLALRAQGARVVLDAAGDALRAGLAAKPFLIKPNLVELTDYLGSTPQTPTEIAAGAAHLQRAGAQNVLVSLGAQGALLLQQSGQALWLTAPKGVLRGSVGAGDAMVAGFVAACARGLPPKRALKYAVASGSAAAFTEWLPSAAQIEQLYAHIDNPQTICYNM